MDTSKNYEFITIYIKKHRKMQYFYLKTRFFDAS